MELKEPGKDIVCTCLLLIAGLSGMSLGIQAMLPFAQTLGWISLFFIYGITLAWIAFWASFAFSIIRAGRRLWRWSRRLRAEAASRPVFPSGRVVKMFEGKRL